MTASRASVRICAVVSTASAVLASRPPMSANGRSSMPCSLNHALPSTQAFCDLVILCPATSTVRVMSSQTQPQNVQVASATVRMVSSLIVLSSLGLLRPHYLDFDLQILGKRHPGPRGVAGHQLAGGRSVGHEEQTRRQVL